jgi:hypothetical protein
MALTTDVALLERFSEVRSLHKMVNSQKDQTSAIRASASQASKDAERLRVSQQENTQQLLAAQREGNQTQMEQLEVEKQNLQLQQQQVESQLRMEQAQSDEQTLETNDDGLVSAMWACVEGAKNNFKDRKFYSSLIFGVSARLSYGQLVSQAQKSDTKMKLSKLNDEARDIMDQLLTDENFQPLLIDATGVFTSLKSLMAATSSANVKSFFESHKYTFSSIDTSTNDIPRIIESLNKLQALDGDIQSEQDKLSKAVDKLSQNDFILTPLSEASIRDFLSIHAEEVQKLKQQVETSSGISIDSTLESVEQLNLLVGKISDLRRQVCDKIASGQARVGEIKSASLTAVMKKKTRTFWLVCVIGLAFSIMLGTLLGPDGSPQRASTVQLWFFGMMVYWFVLRWQKKKQPSN